MLCRIPLCRAHLSISVLCPVCLYACVPVRRAVLLAQLVFWTTCGDRYYLGLDALALYDATGKRIPIRPSQVFASPSSVNDLPGVGGGGGEGDARVPANLCREYNPGAWTNSESWLAPLAHSITPGSPNLLYLVFNQPVTVSMVKVRTPCSPRDCGCSRCCPNPRVCCCCSCCFLMRFSSSPSVRVLPSPVLLLRACALEGCAPVPPPPVSRVCADLELQQRPGEGRG